MLAGRFDVNAKASDFSECWDTTWGFPKSSQLMDQQKEERDSGDHTCNAREMKRAWKIAEERRTQAVREEKLQELHVTWEVKPIKI